MEDKQLDFNQPFLSVRRFSPTVASLEAECKRKTDSQLQKRSHLPVYKSELKSGPVRNPGTVPFTWEQSPGRPKNEGKLPVQAQGRPPTAPKLPPGRIVDVRQPESNKISINTTEIQPHRRSDSSSSGEDHNSSTSNLVTEHDSSKDKADETTSRVEDGDEAYFDAQDTLSRTESFFFNCSVSGLSGLENLDSRLSGRFSTDPQIQDFMMGRFLPAAKAMASETPQHPPKKQPVVQEQPRLVKKTVNVNQQHPLYQYRPGVSPYYGPNGVAIESDDDDEWEPHSSSSKACGLLPRFLLKSSFCLLDPMQGMGIRDGRPTSSVRRVQAKQCRTSPHRESSKMHAGDVIRKQIHVHRSKTSEKLEARSKLIQTDHQFTATRDPWDVDGTSRHIHQLATGRLPDKTGPSHAKSILLEEKSVVGISETAQGNGCTSFRDLLASEGDEWKSSFTGPVVERTLYIDSIQTKLSHKTNTSSHNAEEPSINGGVDLEIHRRNDENKEALLLDSLPQNFKVIDFFDEKEISGCLGRDSIDSGLLSSLPNAMPDKVEKAASFDSTHHDVKEIILVDDKEIGGLQSKESIIPTVPSSEVGFTQVAQMDANGSEQDQLIQNPAREKRNGSCSSGIENRILDGLSNQTPECRFSLEQMQNKTGFPCKQTTAEKIDTGEIQLDMAPNKQEDSGADDSSFLIPPPLPKSPTESWLFRTLPAISSRNSSTRPAAGLQEAKPLHSSKSPPPEPKWETIVKMSGVHQNHLRPSQESLEPIPEC